MLAKMFDALAAHFTYLAEQQRNGDPEMRELGYWLMFTGLCLMLNGVLT